MSLMTQVGLEFIARDRSRYGMRSFESNMRRTRASVMSFGRSVLGLAGIGGGMYMLQRGLRGVISATMTQERAETDLNAALRVRGDLTQSISRDLRNYAADLQKATVYGDEEIISQMGYASNLGVTTDRLQEAAKAAIGLAAKYKLDLRSAMMLVGRASQGQTQMLTRYGIVLDDTLSPQEKFNELLEIGARNFQLARDQAADATGAWEQFKNVVGDLAERAGKPVIPVFTDMTKQMTGAASAGDKVEAAMTRIVAAARVLGRVWKFSMRIPIGLLTRPLGGEEGMAVPGMFELDRASVGMKKLEIKPSMEAKKSWSEIWENAMPTASQIAEQNRTWQEHQKTVLDAARQRIDAIRNMDWLTRRERIANLEAYKAANASTLKDVADANRILNDEIAAIERSRIGGMKIYMGELKEDMESWSLYGSDKWAEAFRSMEASGSNFFLNMQRDADNWKQHLVGLLNEVGMALQRMIADKAARAIFGRIFGTDSGSGGLEFLAERQMAAGEAHGGGRAGSISSRRFVDSSVFDNAPRFHDLRPGETAIIAQNDEVISRPGRPGRRGGSTPPQVVINNYTNQEFTTDGPPKFDGESWVVGIIARNIREAGSIKKMMR